MSISEQLRQAHDAVVRCAEHANGCLLAIGHFNKTINGDEQRAASAIKQLETNLATLQVEISECNRYLFDAETIEPFRQARHEIRHELPQRLRYERSLHEAAVGCAQITFGELHNALLFEGGALERWQLVVKAAARTVFFVAFGALEDEYRHTVGKANAPEPTNGESEPLLIKEWSEEIIRATRVVVGGKATAGLSRIIEIAKSTEKVETKLRQIEKTGLLRPDVSAQDLADLLRVTPTAIKRTRWWRNRMANRRQAKADAELPYYRKHGPRRSHRRR